MPTCSQCGTLILFGGVRDGPRRYCNPDCFRLGTFNSLADEVPQDLVARRVEELHQGDCPKCLGPGPVDVYEAHTIWSAIVFSQFESKQEVCCQSCGQRLIVSAILSSCVCGWWSIPFGLIMTPIQLLRNFAGLLSLPNSSRPSPLLEEVGRMEMAGKVSGVRRANDGIRYTEEDPL